MAYLRTKSYMSHYPDIRTGDASADARGPATQPRVAVKRILWPVVLLAVLVWLLVAFVIGRGI